MPANRSLSFSRRVLASLLVGACLVSVANAQTGRPRRGQPPAQPNQPAQTPGQTPGQSATPSQPAAQPGATQPSTPTEPTVGTLIQHGNEREWTLTARVNVRAFFDQGIDRPASSPTPDQMPTIDRFRFDTLTLVWPVVPRTASSELAFDTPTGQAPTLRDFRFTVDDYDATHLREFSHEILTSTAGGRPYHSGIWLALLKLGRGIDAREVDFEIVLPSRSWQTRFDERAAMAVQWPDGAWPAEAASTLEPMLYVDIGPDVNGRPQRFGDAEVRALLERWTQGKPPRSIPPVQFAKWIAGQVVEHVQVSGAGLAANRNGLLEGVSLQTPGETARTGIGSEFDMVVLLTALYRKAGLPARIVVGYDVEANSRDEPGFLQPGNSGRGELRAWVEFCLYDQASHTINWVPVDPARIRRNSSRLPPNFMEPGRLRYFGEHDELDDVVPFAFQFHPPTTVRSYGSPGFWGWFVTPTAPDRAWQAVSIRASTTPRRGGR